MPAASRGVSGQPSGEATEAVDTLILHGLVVTVDADGAVVADGAVAIRGSRIRAVGPSAEIAARFTAGETIDGRSAWAIRSAPWSRGNAPT